ncbi:MAG: hypothetical protein LBL62_12220 [Planctomycetaceae bacterium]|jgi:hypothetical protein|nr:hypothetical protein [Planctomycetaceae bacterium]
MKLTPVLLLIIGLLFVFNSGCCPQKPAGFPNTVPYTIIVKNNEQPEKDVSIFLYPEEPISGDWVVGGKSDSSGRTHLVTSQGHYIAQGVPEGKFKVILNKKVKIPGTVSEEEYKKMTGREKETYGNKIRLEREKIPLIVPKILTDPSNTPIIVEVSTSNSETVIELKDYKKGDEFPDRMVIPVQN